MGQMAAPLTSHSVKLDDSQAKKLKVWAEARGFPFREVAHASFAFTGPDYQVTFYKSGKLLVQGKGTRDFVEFLLEPEILKALTLAEVEAPQSDDLYVPRIGVDESGKGDFFGPLTVAGAYGNEAIIRKLIEIGVKDSKSIGTDQKIARLAIQIKAIPGFVYAIVPIGNEAYNRLHGTMKSVNRILAWGHARVIENLTGQFHRMNPAPRRAVCDQFARTEKTIASALMKAGRELEIVQKHKAEEDPVVAAASILARDEFVRRLGKLGEPFGVKLPKGASNQVKQVAMDIAKSRGGEALATISKVHFKTTQEILGALK